VKNGDPQGSLLETLLFNIYISDLPTTVSKKYAHADDLENIHANANWQSVRVVLSKDLVALEGYL